MKTPGTWPALQPFVFLILASIVSFGTLRAFQHGGFDFNVFYGAWRLVVEGHAQEVFSKSSDRFLYAPGFAVLLSPFGLLSRDTALGLWSVLKTVALGTLLANCLRLEREARPPNNPGEVTKLRVLAMLAPIFLARPLLVEYEYGQVNLFILGSALWALAAFFDRQSSRTETFLAWSVATFFGIAKLLTLPILVLPLVADSRRQSRSAALFGILFGGLITLFSPFFILPWQTLFDLYRQWGQALAARGLPLETHNQSFTALAYHFTSGLPTPIHALSGGPLHLGSKLLELHQIQLLSAAWTFLAVAFLLGFIISSPFQQPLKSTSTILGLAILPSYLIWKPYFIFGVPLAVHFFFHLKWTPSEQCLEGRNLLLLGLGGVAFVAINFLGFDFIGYQLAGPIEAASPLLLCHLILLFASNQVSFVHSTQKGASA